MDLHSLKRVLTELKGEARKMRKSELGSRLASVADKQDEAVDEVKMPSIGRPKPASVEVVEAQAAPNEALAEETVRGNAGALAEASGGSEDEDLKRILKKHGL